MNKSESKQIYSFQAETKELLNIMINSLYTHREIFLRELLSNACDALEKVSFLSLTDEKILEGDHELHINIDIDVENKTLTISDNGIGMTYNEVVENIGTIAKSGSKLFLDNLSRKNNFDLIGKFGVGFYSSFMVAKKIVLLSRAAKDTKGVKWESEGDGSYMIETTDITQRGTKIILYLKDDAVDKNKPEADYSNQYTIRNLVEKYSNYIRFPIKMDMSRDEYPRDKEGKIIENAQPTIVVESTTLNSMIPIWERNKKDISRDDYFQFYKHYFHDWTEFAEVIHLKAEGKIQYTALLFIPSQATSSLYEQDSLSGIDLYSNRIFVMKDCREILSHHLRFVRGIIDSPDFSLNISREFLQNDLQLSLIRKNLEKKVIEVLAKMLQENRKKYEEIWIEIGKAIKGGIYMEYQNKETLQNLLLFPSSKSGGKLTTLKEYIDRMTTEQSEIYYATGKDVVTIERLPHLELLKEKNIEILYFIDKIDEFLTQNLDQFENKKLKSISREDFQIDNIDNKDINRKTGGDNNNSKQQEKNTNHTELLTTIKKHLGEKVKDVRLSMRLKASPVCIVAGNTGPSFNMEQLLRGANQISPRATKVLEINPDHKIFTILVKIFQKDKNSKDMYNLCEILYNQALLIEGYEIDDPVDFSKRMSELMVSAYINY